MAFFGSREYVISPILNGLREASASVEGQGQGQAQGAGVGGGVGQVRSLRVLDSAIAGAVAGSGLSFGLRECERENGGEGEHGVRTDARTRTRTRTTGGWNLELQASSFELRSDLFGRRRYACTLCHVHCC
jgi:hypothetical protein